MFHVKHFVIEHMFDIVSRETSLDAKEAPSACANVYKSSNFDAKTEFLMQNVSRETKNLQDFQYMYCIFGRCML